MHYQIVIPVLNQLQYTQQCVDTLLAQGVAPSTLLIIDNGSTDGTPAWLNSRPDLPSLRNPVNLGCGGAWTQGALVGDSPWVVLLNNDVVFGHDAIGRSLAAAERMGLDVVSPALVEGELDYDLTAFSERFGNEMAGQQRENFFHGVCFAVRRQVFHRLGFFDTDRDLGGREDTEFLFRCRRHGVAMAMVGDAVLHHYGSITQKAMKLEQGVREFGDHRYLYGKLGLSWLGRQRFKHQRRQRERQWRNAELTAHGMTLHMDRRGGDWVYR